MVRHTAADSAYVFMVDGSGESMRVVAGTGGERAQILGTLRRRGETMSGMAWERGEAVFVADAATDPLTRSDRAPATQLFAVPMHHDGEVRGVLVAASGANSVDTTAQLELIERLTNLAALAVNHARQVAANAAELRRSRALGRLGAILSDFAGTDADFEQLARTLADALDATRADVWLADASGELSEFVAGAVGPAAAGGDGTVRVPPAPREIMPESVMQRCCTHARSADYGRDAEDPRESARVHAARGRYRVGSTACTPLVVDGRVVGVIPLVRDRPAPDPCAARPVRRARLPTAHRHEHRREPLPR